MVTPAKLLKYSLEANEIADALTAAAKARNKWRQAATRALRARFKQAAADVLRNPEISQELKRLSRSLDRLFARLEEDKIEVNEGPAYPDQLELGDPEELIDTLSQVDDDTVRDLFPGPDDLEEGADAMRDLARELARYARESS
jgi:hypothetical protein